MTASARATVVLDVGKTLSKLSLWDGDGSLIERRVRPNDCVDTPAYRALDVDGIGAWLVKTLADFARHAPVGAIIPVAHGAAAAIVRDGRLACAPMDYESAIPAEVRTRYDRLRDAFAQTGSPALPGGLNLGAQLWWLGELHPPLYARSCQILLWPQYWAWRLCGIAACEVSSLGCHTDLWQPMAARPTLLAERSGWAARLPPVRFAGSVLGPISPEVAAQTGLPADVAVHCGLHDSNAALVAARGCAELGTQEATVLSTGTWFVAMRSPGDCVLVDMTRLSAHRDCLVNVDVHGKPVPSARFMGGREIEVLLGTEILRVDSPSDQAALVEAVPSVVGSGCQVLPTFAHGSGPYPDRQGQWLERPAGQPAQRAAVCLYAALVARTSLELIGARKRILIEGRFAAAEVFARALASLCPDAQVYGSRAEDGVACGALRLVNPALVPSAPLARVRPLDLGLENYAAAWRAQCDRPGAGR